MSTSETETITLQPCPCGKGKITKTVTTQDNCWSSADVYYELECDTCKAEWDFSSSGGYLTLRSSLIPWQKASQAASKAHSALNGYLERLAAKYFATKALPTKKAEHACLVELGVFSGSYRSYLGSRKTRPIHKIGYLSGCPEFVDQLVQNYGDKVTFQTLVNAVNERDKLAEAASAKIIRQKAGP